METPSIVVLLWASYLTFVQAHMGFNPSDVRISSMEVSPGRIKKMDKLLEEHSKAITLGQKLNRLRRELKNIADEVNEDPEVEQYYQDVVDIIDGVGADGLKDERDRLNTIITSGSGRSNDPAAKAETDYAVKRRAVIEAYVDATAQYLLATMSEQVGVSGFHYNPNADNNFEKEDL